MSKTAVSAQSPAKVLDLLPPFPIVLVTTHNNIITVNQIEYFTFTPLRIGISIAHSRHTYGLLKTQGEFVINVPDETMIDVVKICGKLSGRDADKFQVTGMDAEAIEGVQAAGIAQCGAQIACRVEREIDFEHRTWFVGRVVAARKGKAHRGMRSLMCGRHEYVVPGTVISAR
jgi:flavin reductase (DIM6/NTAB) family NADH-FMN oxidoreductase RutF